MLHSKRIRVLAVFAVLVAALLLPFPIRANRARVTAAIAQSLGRPVTIGSIHYRLFPWPGFTIEGFVVADDPAFSLEPVIHADNVTVNIRLASLWRGRLEVSRISLDDPSLNLVRNEAGRWNLEAIVLRAAQIPTAPTTRKLAEQRARFPYIEASSGRINFRLGNEKTHFTFMESDFALWLGAEDRWNLRFTARPSRTDMNLSDLGLVRVNGTIQRAGSLADTPLNLHVSWDGGQLGQATKLFVGEDRGWRGGVLANADVAGTPNDMAFTLRVELDGFRRADLLPLDALDLRSECTGHAHAASGSLSPLNCTLPMSGGLVAMRGTIANLHGSPRPDLRLTAENVPASALLELARRTKRSIPRDLQAAGSLDAVFVLSNEETRAPDEPAWKGNGILAGLRLSSAQLSPALPVGDIRFEKGIQIPMPLQRGKRLRTAGTRTIAASSDMTLTPFAIDLGGSVPARVNGRISARDYSLSLQGPAEATRLLALGSALGLRPIQTNAQGTVDIEATISGATGDFAPPIVTGTASIEKLVWRPGQVNSPITITGGAIALTPQTAHISDLAMAIGNDLSVQGELEFQRGCSPITDCQFDFRLDAPVVSTEALNGSFNPALRDRGFSFFGGSQPSSKWGWLKAQGTVQADQLLLGKLTAQHASARVNIANGRIALENVSFQCLNGEHTGNWTLDFTGGHLKFDGNGWFKHAAVADAQKLFREDWGSGVADAKYSLVFSGQNAADFVRSAEGTIDLSVKNGAWKHVQVPARAKTPTEAAPLSFATLNVPLQLTAGVLKVKHGVLVDGRRSLVIDGTIGLDRVLDLEFTPGAAGNHAGAFHASGTAQHPTITPATIAHALIR